MTTTAPGNRVLWEGALSQIEAEVSAPNFRTWFKETFITRIDDGTVYIGVPNPFVKDWLRTKFHRVILKSLRDIADSVRSVEYVITKAERARAAMNARIEIKQNQPQTNSAQLPNKELPLADHYVSREDNLNPRYTFESFVIGRFNDLAFAAAQAVVRQPGIAYNPLFVYGNTGYGKTHLMQAVGNAIRTAHKDKKVYYLTSEKFASEFFQSLQSNRMAQFKDKYRRYDVLIMDDIQFFSGKEKTEEELFHLFNALYDTNRQIVFSSDRHPNYLPNISDRLRSRFGQGMIVDIQKPDVESRMNILKVKLTAAKVEIDNEALLHVAETIDGNIREIEGVVNSIVCQTALRGQSLSSIDIRELVKVSAKPRKAVSAEDIIKAVSSFYSIDPMEIADKTRRKEVVLPRQLTMYILRNDYGISYPTIGDKVGGRDHTTVIHSCDKIKNDLKRDPQLQQQLNQIRAML